MQTTKKLTAISLFLCLVLGLSGCGGENLKDKLLDGYNNFLQFSSRHALTKESKLQGKKTKGEDAYVGRYTAEYEDFDGKEYIFGATGLERETGNDLTAAYTLKISSGSATIAWIHSGSEYIITNSEGEDTFQITIGSGDNYIVLEGEGFTGSFELEVK